MTAYLDELHAYIQELGKKGLLNSDYREAVREILERHATPIILAQGEKFFTMDIVTALGVSEKSLGQEKEWVQSLCEGMTRKGPINGRMLFQSKDRPRRFFWIVEE